jgi:hypothetical protein
MTLNKNIDHLTKDCPRTSNVHLTKILYDHQLTAVHACIDLENQKYCLPPNNILLKYGILSDIVGSGKTYIILGLIFANPSLKTVFWEDYKLSSLVKVVPTHPTQHVDTNIIVVPFMLLDHWISAAKLMGLTSSVVKNKTGTEVAFTTNQCNVTIVTNTQYEQVEEYIRTHNIYVTRVVFDNVCTMDVKRCREISSKFYWLVTDNWTNMMTRVKRQGKSLTNDFVNSLIDDHVYLHNIFFPVMKKVIIKNDETYLRESMKGLLEKQMTYFYYPLNVGVQCGDWVADGTPLWSMTSDFKDYIMPKSMVEDHVSKNIHIRNKEDVMRDISGEESCNLCYEYFVIKCLTKCCYNTFCAHCIDRWAESCRDNNTTCPYCKKSLTLKKLFIMNMREDEHYSKIHEAIGDDKRVIIYCSKKHSQSITTRINTMNEKTQVYNLSRYPNYNTLHSFESQFDTNNTSVLITNDVNICPGIRFKGVESVVFFSRTSDKGILLDKIDSPLLKVHAFE